jgi:N-acetylneuraminic acid mutarotase
MFTRHKLKSRIPLFLLVCFLLSFTFGFSPAELNHYTFDLSSEPNRPAYPPLTWYALANKGLNGHVYALAVSGDNLYVGGQFNATGDGTGKTSLGNIARYDIKTSTWHALPNKGLDGSVRALAVSGADLYVGGDFDKTGDGTTWTNLGNIARYNENDNSWYPLPESGLNGMVMALAVSGDDLFVGGSFSNTGGSSPKYLSNIARYDTSSPGWHALPGGNNNGVDGVVFALAVEGKDLYVGGGFSQAFGSSTVSTGNIARYDTATSTWYPLSSGGLDASVRALVLHGSDLYVGGSFLQTKDTTVPNLGRIARYKINDESWEGLPNDGLNNTVYALAVSGDDLYVGGLFNNLGDSSETDANYIARYDKKSNAWHPLPEKGLTHYVYALEDSWENLFVGGSFPSTKGTKFAHVLNYIGWVSLDYPKYHDYLPLVFKR